MNYFIKSLIFHVFALLLFSLASYFSFKEKKTLNNVALISYSELKNKQLELEKQKLVVLKEQKKQEVVQKEQEVKKEQKKPDLEIKKDKQNQVVEREPKKEKTEKIKEVVKPKAVEKKVKENKKPEEIQQPQKATVVKPEASVVGSFDFDAIKSPPKAALDTAVQESKATQKVMQKEQEETVEQESQVKTEEPVEQNQDTELNSFLDSYASNSEASAGQAIAKNSNQDASLTENEYNILEAQIRSCWFFRGTAPTDEEVANINVQLEISMNKDATVADIKVVGNYNSSTRKILLRHAVSALKNPNCIPLKLPLGKYKEWKQITINFSN